MKLKSVLLAGAVAALPLGAFAQSDPPPPQRQTTTQQTTTTTNEAGDTKETTKIVTVTGMVQSFDAGHSITIVNDKGEATTYTLVDTSEVPKTVEVGKTVTIRTTSVSGSPVVKTITTTTTKETKKKSY